MFRNRRQAGYQLSKKVRALDFLAKTGPLQAVVYGLSSSSMPIAAEVALALNCPLESLLSVDLLSPADASVMGSVAIIVDDGINNSAKTLAVVDLLKQRSAQILVVAAPVIRLDAFRQISTRVDGCIALLTPERTKGFSDYYMNFEFLTDLDVASILSEYNDDFMRSA